MVPLPEISTATLARPTTVQPRCVASQRFARAPCLYAALNCAAALARLDRTDDEDRFSRRFEFRLQSRHFVGGYRQHHADAAVESARHFGGLDIALGLQESHQAGLRPGACIDAGVKALGQDARYVLEQAAAGDMGKRMHAALPDHGQKAFHVDARRFDQVVDQQTVGIEQRRAIQLPALVGRQPPHQRIAVGVHPRGSQPQQHVTRGDLLAGQLLATFDGADAEACEIVVAGGIHARHLRRLAADQRAAGEPAALGNTGDDALGHAVVELAGGEVVQEEQRLGALDDQVVDAHGDQILADAVMTVVIDGEFYLGADAVVGGDQQRIPVARGARVEEAAEAAELGIRAWPRCRFRQRADGFDQRVSSGDRDAGVLVSIAVEAWVIGHCRAVSLFALGFP